MSEFKSTREGYGDALLELGQEDSNIVVVCADLLASTWSHEFAKEFPERFVQVGVAEQNMAGISAGLALSGKTVFMASYACFSPGRNYDFIRTQICYSNANVKIIGSHAGLSAGPDGATHQMLEDVAITRALPNTTVISPCDYWEAKKAVKESAKIKGPVYIRLHREKSRILTEESDKFQLGKWSSFGHGDDVCLIAHGPILDQVLEARKALAEQGVSAQVVNASTIKPLDSETLLQIAENFRRVFVVEEHQKAGGLGGAICEYLAEKDGLRPKVAILGVNNAFGESGNYLQLLAKHGLDKEGVVRIVLESIEATKK